VPNPGRTLAAGGPDRRAGRARDHVLSLNAGPLSEAADWIAHYQRFWEQSLAALDDFATGKKPTRRKSR
jgi:hypothetical protein